MTAKNAKSTRGKTARAAAKGKTQELSQVPPTRATGAETATGQAIRTADGTNETPQGEDRGSKVPIVGGEPQPDLLEGAAPKGAQLEPAKFSSNGQLEGGTVGSPTGSIPVSAVARDQEHADELLEKADAEHAKFLNRSFKDKKLDDRTLSHIGGAELRAIAAKRGYDIPEAGTRATRAAFARAQDDDENLLEDDTE